MKIPALLITWILVMQSIAVAEISEHDATKAILGEARGEGYQGMLAVACAIRNRNSLKGVYGFNQKFSCSPKYWKLARSAWQEASTRDITNGATVWGTEADIKIFKKTKWFSKFKQTVKIKNHTFFKEEK